MESNKEKFVKTLAKVDEQSCIKQIPISSQKELEECLTSLKDDIVKIDVNSRNYALSYDAYEKIQTLETQKGKFLCISYEKDPSPKQLLDLDKAILNTVSSKFQEVYTSLEEQSNYINTMSKVLRTFTLLSGITFYRIGQVYNLLRETHKNLQSNCDVTTEQGRQVKEIALMQLEGLVDEIRRKEQIDNLIDVELPLLKDRQTSIENINDQIRNKIGSDIIELKAYVSSMETSLNTQTQKIQQEIDEANAYLEELKEKQSAFCHEFDLLKEQYKEVNLRSKWAYIIAGVAVIVDIVLIFSYFIINSINH